MRSEMVVRFDYGWIVPWVRRCDGGVSAIAGPDMLQFRPGVEHHGERLTTVSEFTVSEGQRVPFTLAWHPSHELPPPGMDAEAAVSTADNWWREWSSRCTFQGPEADREAVVRSLITLKALTFAPTGGILAAATTSLPEEIGSVRNWDYRFCWLRDATLTLLALINSGYLDEARDWRGWLLRAVAGSPEHLQIMYGLAGERRLDELVLDWLSGYEGSRPVRVGNAASRQFQLDVFGEVMDAMYQAYHSGLAPLDDGWRMATSLFDHLETVWNEPDEGIWEVRGPRQHFTHSKVMAWVAFDRAVKAVEVHGQLSDHVDRWRATRDAIHADVCSQGFDARRNTFVQAYGSTHLDASLLLIPLVGFLPANDPRVVGTTAAIARELNQNGFVCRYDTDSTIDGLPPGEGAFLPCTFWLADNLALQGRRDEARALFDRLLAVRNDVGLLSEEFDPVANRLLGNFPQAFSHVSLVGSACNLARQAAADQRGKA
jgi:GH15 family glucan-1,4-alpha-glucosidase